MTQKHLLFVFTSASKTLKGNPTGYYLPEAAHTYWVLAPHCEIDFASPKGPNPPVDPNSVTSYKEDPECTKFLSDEFVQTKFASAKKLSEVDSGDYAAVFYVGGHGPVLDLATDPVNIKLASEFYRDGKIVASVCHGPGALVNIKDAHGNSIWDGKAFTCFSNVEEESVGMTKDVPFLIEEKFVSLGGQYQKAAAPWGAKVVISGQLITGQNPASSKGVGEAILSALR